MIIALCLIIIAVTMQNFERPQLICSINFLHHNSMSSFISSLENMSASFRVCFKKGACSMCIHVTASIGN